MPFSITLWVNPAATQVEHADILGNHGEPFVGINLQQDGTKTELLRLRLWRRPASGRARARAS